ncbi:hypothetical protein ElyMa_006450300 [Elysia marginata]|uniref:Uncharacterized protein n=1 Tax=Elysia marginata TaxID=1093978 RepID=A0AAV4HWT8_9GAST|nr:hypothetical protein ElyMa_006450300 [Elysia marginata]
MVTVFWDAKDVILLDLVLQCQCINAVRYCITVDRITDATRRKDLDSSEGVLCLSTIIRPWIQKTLHRLYFTAGKFSGYSPSCLQSKPGTL